MGPEFDRRTPVLAFEPKLPSGRDLARNYILWPVLGYQVVAPESVGEEMDILEKAVLGLCRAGVRSAVEQAAALRMHPELVAYVLDGLVQAGSVTGEGRPTERGLTALQADGQVAGELVTGWVFQDPWQLELWPRFYRGVQFFETEIVDNHVKLDLGTLGRPDSHGTFSVFPPQGLPLRTPRPEDVLEAVRLGAKARRFQERGGDQGFDPDDEDADDVIPEVVTMHDRHRDIARVCRVLEDPHPYYIAIQAYLPKGEAVKNWETVSPFSRRPNHRLREWIAREAKENKGLKSWLAHLSGEAYARANPDEALRLAEADALRRVEEALPAMQQLAIPASEMDGLVRALGMAEEDAARVGNTPERGRDVAAKAGLVLETFVRLLNGVEDFRHISAIDLVPAGLTERDHKAVTRPMVNQAVKDLTGREAPHGLLARSRPDNLRSALLPTNRESGRARMAAMVLHAKFIPEHPLRTACEGDPDLIVKFDRVYQARNEANHDNPRAFSSDEARSLLRDTYDVLERLAEGWLASTRMEHQSTNMRLR